MTYTIRKSYYKLCIVLSLVLAFSLGKPILAETFEPSRNIEKLIKEQPSKTNLIVSTYKKYPILTEYYSQRQGFFAVEAIRENPILAIYSMEVFPGYFKNLAESVGGEEAINFIGAASYHPEFLDEYSEKLEKYKDKPKLLGLLIRSHAYAKDHLITELETSSHYLASRLIELYGQASPAVRNGILETPQASFFLLETKEEGLAYIQRYGSIVAEIATFYQPGQRHEVLHELNIGGKNFIAAYQESSIVGWRTATRFPKLYCSLVEYLGISEALSFLNTNSHYFASSVEDPTDDAWILSVIQSIKDLQREGIFQYASADSFAFALSFEEEEGKELIARMGKYLPAALIYHNYPRHKAFLCKFLNRYGIAPLKTLYTYAKDDSKKHRLEKIMDKFSSHGLLLVTYADRPSETVDFLLEDGYDRGQSYVHKFKFDEYGIPSYVGSSSYMPEIAKVTVNYFWYGTQPTWAELGLAIWDAVDYLHMIYSFGSSKLLTQSGKMLFGHASQYVFVKVAKHEAEKFTIDKLKDIALNIAWKALKKVLKKELMHQRFNQLEKMTVMTVTTRMGKNFVKSSWEYSHRMALNEFLNSYVFDKK